MLKKITWIGQAGLLFETETLKIIVDPYLSDSVVKVNPKNYRRVPVDSSFLDIHPDALLITHDHLDHLDPETLPVYLSREDKRIDVLCSAQSFTKLVAQGHGHNYIRMVPGNEWTLCDGTRITAVCAFHSEPTAVGYILDFDGQRHYITGDTLYNEQLLSALPDDLFALYLPVNGVGNNMNLTDAARLADKIAAQHTIPLHFGMFDQLSVPENALPRAFIPSLYKEIDIL